MGILIPWLSQLVILVEKRSSTKNNVRARTDNLLEQSKLDVSGRMNGVLTALSILMLARVHQDTGFVIDWVRGAQEVGSPQGSFCCDPGGKR